MVAALPEHDQKGKANERLDRRHEHTPCADEFDIASNVLAVGLVETADFGFFLRVGPDDADAREIFLHFGGKRGERSLNRFVEIVDNFAKVTDGHKNDRYGQQDPPGQGGRKPRHDHDGHDHRDQRLAGVHNTGAENHAHVVEVIGGARHQFASTIANVEFGFHKQQAIKQSSAQIEFDVT